MTQRVYLDWNATAPLCKEARDAMVSAMAVLGNPSSVHAEGRAARAIVERARSQVAAAVGGQPDEVVFTSGATEAAGVLAAPPGGAEVVVDPTAHDALWAHRGAGDPAQGRILAMGLANSESGLITEPVWEAAGWTAPDGAAAGRLLLDVTQAIGRIPFAFTWSRADFAVLSAHKLGGPKGVGALLVRQGQDMAALRAGGGQELGRRSGTENVIGIAGFGAAIEAAVAAQAAGHWNRVAKLRNILEKGLATEAPDTIFVAQADRRLPNTSSFAVPGWKSETQVMQMDLAGFAISAGSACSSGKVRQSRVWEAMGYDTATARSAIRVSIGPSTREDEIERFIDAWAVAYRKYRARAA